MVHELGGPSVDNWRVVIREAGNFAQIAERLLELISDRQFLSHIDVQSALKELNNDAGCKVMEQFCQTAVSKGACRSASRMDVTQQEWPKLAQSLSYAVLTLERILELYPDAPLRFQLSIEAIDDRWGLLSKSFGAETTARATELQEKIEIMMRRAESARMDKSSADMKVITDLTSVAAQQSRRGILDDPLHDEDYKALTVVPTSEELFAPPPAALPAILAALSRSRLPPRSGYDGDEEEDEAAADTSMAAMHHSEVLPAAADVTYRSAHHYINTHFQLLREEAIAQLRRGLQRFKDMLPEGDITKENLVHTAAAMSGGGNDRINVYLDVQINALQDVRTGVGYEVTFVTPGRKVDWSASRRFMTGSLLVLLPLDIVAPAAILPAKNNGKSKTEASSPKYRVGLSPEQLILATVVKSVDAVALQKNKGKAPAITINVENTEEFSDSHSYVMLESPVFFDSIRPVLEALKEFSSRGLPFEDLLLGRQQEIPPPLYLSQGGERRGWDLSSLFPGLHNWGVGAALPQRSGLYSLDSSQRSAIKMALSQRIALIQGPPGTGKTFIGVLLTRILLANAGLRSDRPIVFVCLTNHALDSILERVYEFEQDIIRVGGRSSSETMKKLSMAERARDGKKTRLRPPEEFYQAMRSKDVVFDAIRQCIGASRLADPLFSFSNALLYRAYYIIKKEFGTEAANVLLSVIKQTKEDTRFLAWKAALEAAISFTDEHRYLKWAPEQGGFDEWAKLSPEDIALFMSSFNPLISHMDETIVDDWLSQDVRKSKNSRRKAQEMKDSLDSQAGSKKSFEKDDIMPDNDFEEEEDLEEIRRRQLDDDDDAYHRDMFGLGNDPLSSYQNDIDKAKQLAQRVNERSTSPDLLISADLSDDEVRALRQNHPPHARDIPAGDRVHLVKAWRKLLVRDAALAMPELRKQAADIANVISSHRARSDAMLLSSARVIGLTTNGAAKYRKQLKELGSEVLIVEEAAEVREADVVACMTSATKHVILIGDHLQLRPQVGEFHLAQTYSLDVSLFERFVNMRLPHVTLTTQRRMHPDISSLIRPSIYKDLKDDPSTLNHPDVRGMCHRLFFMTHQVPEDNAGGEVSSSKINKHEAGIAARLALYLTYHKYKVKDIVILTMYLGQVRLIRSMLKHKDFSPIADVRVVTTDNYQGEESDIIILSIVRSNKEGNIGFLKRENRICVALSRARNGMFVIGNMDMLRQKSVLWNKICGDAEARRLLGPSLVLQPCKTHDDSQLEVTNADDFLNAPLGGCGKLCLATFPDCGHTCKLTCHPTPHGEEGIRCSYPCMRPRPPTCTHPCRASCGDVCPPCPAKVMRDRPACGHRISVRCSDDVAKVSCSATCGAPLPCGHPCKATCHGAGHLPALAIYCNEPCQRMHPCGHPCKKKCGDVCGGCTDGIMKPLTCGHKAFVKCADQGDPVCKKNCRKKLACGHACAKICSDICTLPTDCKVKVKKEISGCGATVRHTAMASCGASPPQVGACTAVCGVTMDCGHTCKSTCNDCTALKAHSVCSEKCTLTCEHGVVCTGNHPCSDGGVCPPSPMRALCCTDTLIDRDIELISLHYARDAAAGKAADARKRLERMVSWWVSGDARLSVARALLAQDYLSTREWFKAERTAKLARKGPGVDQCALTLIMCRGMMGGDTLSFARQPPVVLRTIVQELKAFIGSDDAARALHDGAFDELQRRQASVTNLASQFSSAMNIVPPSLATASIQSSSAPVSTANPTFPSASLPAPTALAAGTPGPKQQQQPAEPAGTTPLHRAARQGTVDDISRLLAAGADPAARDTDGNTALIISILSRDEVNVTCALLDAGAWHVVNEAQRTVGEMASQLTGAAASFVMDAMKAECAKSTTEADPTRLWAAKRALDGAHLDAMDELMRMTGLASVKREALKLYDIVELDKDRPPEARTSKRSAFNFIFEGNPGTGKTTVARIFGRLLEELGIREDGAFVSKTGQDLLSAGSNAFTQTLSSVIPGVLFVDEVYQLAPTKGGEGAAITNAIMDACEDKRDQLSIIIAGYKEDIRDKFMAYNPGLLSRFPITVTFEDFSEKELRSIILSTVREYGWSIEASNSGVDTATVAARRLVRAANKKGFGNARSARVMVEGAIAKANTRMSRMARPPRGADTCVLTRRDILGEPIDPDRSATVKQLRQLVGLDDVKKSVESLVRLTKENYESELRGEVPIDVSLHRLFVGNPGTGKTSVAKLYGKVLSEMGMLSKGEVEVIGASQLTGDVVGSAAKKTNSVFDGAKGKVLVIDEAYVLSTTQYGREALDVIVERVQGGPFEDMAVILCGYDQQIKEMLRNGNPGLARRFRVEDAFHFADFDDKQLASILETSAKEMGLYLTPEIARGAVTHVLAKQRDKPNFGNAGAAKNLLEKGKEAMLRRSVGAPEKHKGLWILQADDLYVAPVPGQAMAALRKMANVEDIIGQLEKEMKSAKASLKGGKKRADLLQHWVFRGPPGTGKTTVARAFGEVFHGIGLLSDARVVECKATDLMAQYVGQTAPLVNEKMKEALGGVLFIDEAYGLIPRHGNAFAREAIEALLANITDTQYAGKMMVVLAGYDSDMNMLLKSNPGLPRRFTKSITFKSWKPEACLALCRSRLAPVELPPELDGLIIDMFEKLSRREGWGNAGDVGTVADKIGHSRDQRCDDDGNVEGPVLESDVRAAFEEMFEQRPDMAKPEPAKPLKEEIPEVAVRTADPQAAPAARTKQAEQEQESAAEATKEETEVQVQFEGGGDDDDDLESLGAALDGALTDRGMTLDMKRDTLKAPPLADDIVNDVAAAVGKRVTGKLRSLLANECPKLLAMIERAIAAKLEEQRRLKEAADEAERIAILKEIQRKEAIQAKLRAVGRCSMGYDWIEVGNGHYRCSAGGHTAHIDEIGIDVDA